MRSTMLGVVVVGTLCLSTISESWAAVNPDAVAQGMVKALNENQSKGSRGGLGDLEGEEKAGLKEAVNGILEAATATTGEALSDTKKFQVILQLRGWFAARTPLTPEIVAKYESRFKAIDKATLEAWRAAEEKSGMEIGNSPTLTLISLAFQDFLFEGSEWRTGNPARALHRLESFPRDVVSRWQEAAKGSGAGDVAPWSLLAVDDLFLDDAFQSQVFDAALPIAQKMLQQP